MPDTTPEKENDPIVPPKNQRRRFVISLVLIALFTSLLTAFVSYMLINISERKREAQVTFVRLANFDENTSDPIPWSTTFPRQYDSYAKTVDVTKTRYGGSDGLPEQKIERDPWLKRMFLGYAFSLDYRDRRGHAYMLSDQEKTERVMQRPQAGACLNCHSSVVPTYRRLGQEALGTKSDPHDFDWNAVNKGFEKISTMKYTDAYAELQKTPDGRMDGQKPTEGAGNVQPMPATGPGVKGPTTREILAAHAGGNAHPVSCVDCHDPKTMELRVTRPAFVRGIQALAQSDEPVPHLPSIERWRKGNRATLYDPNRDATRQEMRSFSCGQCHVEYYCAPKTTMFFPWNNGLKMEKQEAYYESYKFPDGGKFFDYKHAENGGEIFKAQHPEFEMWSQGTHARAGVSCADCHMPYTREGAVKVSDHWVRSPALNIARACQQCHPTSEEDLKARIDTIQDRTHHLMQRSGTAVVTMLDAIKSAQAAGVTPDKLAPALALQKKAIWRLDWVAAENSMGFHGPQEAARILGESIDYARQAQVEAIKVTPGINMPAAPAPTTTMPTGVTPKSEAPPGSGNR